VLAPVALLLLAGLFFSEERPSPRHCVAALVAGLLALVAVAAVGTGAGAEWDVDAAWIGWRATAVIAVVGLVAWWTRAPEHRRRGASAVLAAAFVLGLGHAVVSWRSAFGTWTVPRGEGLLASLASRPDLAPAGGAPMRVHLPLDAARHNAGMVLGTSTEAGYVAFSLDRVWTFIHEAAGVPLPRNNTFPAPEIFARPFPYDSLSLTVGAAERRFEVRRDPDPRAFLAPCAESVPTWRDAVTRIAGGHDVHRCALIENARAASVPRSLAAGSASIVSFAAERVRVRVDAPGEALLVLSEAWYPGWRATVDGRDVPVLPANAWMRAAVVPAGAREVVFEFRSRLLGPGALVTALGLAALALALRRGDATS
jgi:hypothetical protein